ncbi:GDSL-type esterase/lipase family protein [Enterobacter hormaechei]
MKRIAIIPARSGSKGLVDKNILMLIDKPLIAYTILAALKSALFDRVIVSTDSEKYKSIAESYGAEVIMRDAYHASDTASSFMVIDHALGKLNEDFDYFVLLQPTSPFRDANHIMEAAKRFEQKDNFDFLVSMNESPVHASLIKTIDEDLSLKNYDLDYSTYRRQSCTEYHPNGAMFFAKVDAYRRQKHFFGDKSLAYIMDKQSSIDIDDKLDFEFAITIANKINKEKKLKESIISKIMDNKEYFSSAVGEITLIGHSLFANWNINQIGSKIVNNFGIAGINTKQYIKYILEPKIIGHIGDYTFVFAGTNDIVDADWTTEENIKEIQNLVNKILCINPKTKLYLLSVPPVKGRLDRNNKTIRKLNAAIEKYIVYCKVINLTAEFSDEYGELKSHFTYDGLHFTDKAYLQLEKIIQGTLE